MRAVLTVLTPTFSSIREPMIVLTLSITRMQLFHDIFKILKATHVTVFEIKFALLLFALFGKG
jgi:hypothetical protein